MNRAVNTPSNNCHPSVAIIGASLAGASAAARLGQSGFSVTIIDKDQFPRRKPCGEGLCALGISALNDLGIYIDRAPHWRFDRYQVFVGDRSFELPAHWSGVGIERYVLDELVNQSCQRYPTVTQLFGTKALSINEHGIVTAAGEIRADYIVIADGTDSAFAARLGAESHRVGSSLNAASVLFEGGFAHSDSAVKIILGKNWELFATRISTTKLNLSVVTEQTGINVRKILEDKAILRQIFALIGFHGELCGPMLGRSNIGNVRRTLNSERCFLAGDAREEFDPCGGMGMSHAILSGVVVAEAIIQGAKQKNMQSAITERERRMSRFERPMRFLTRLAKHSLSSSRRFPWILGFGKSRITKTIISHFTKELSS